MILGAVSNSWREALPSTDLPLLVERVQQRGAAHIELRQTCMGQYEEGSEDGWRPVADKMAGLANTFPQLTFNLAIAYPCLTTEPEVAAPRFQASLQAAKAVGVGTPRLRLVDQSKFDSPWERVEEIPPTASGVAELARESARQGVRLFIENAGQPIRSMGHVVRAARERLGSEEASFLGLCVDPINSMLADPGSDPIGEIEELPPDYIFMVHFKQTRDGRPHTSVDDGDLNYARLLRMLNARGYDGLALLEIPSDAGVLDNFQQSVEYLRRLMATG